MCILYTHSLELAGWLELSLCIVKWRSLNYFDKHWLCGQFSWNDNYLINGLKHFHLFGFG